MIERFNSFHRESLEKQRTEFGENGEQLLKMFFEVIEKLNYDKKIMLFLIPTIDGILSDSKSNLQIIVNLVLGLKDIEDNHILTLFKNLLYQPKFDKIVYDSAAKILAMILGELPNKFFTTEQSSHLMFLTKQDSLNGRDKDNEDLKLSPYGIQTSYAHLFKI